MMLIESDIYKPVTITFITHFIDTIFYNISLNNGSLIGFGASEIFTLIDCFESILFFFPHFAIIGLRYFKHLDQYGGVR